jgi:hypothetical protein
MNQPSEVVEFTVRGKFVSQISVDPNTVGFGLAVMTPSGDIARFSAAENNANTVLIWTLQLPQPIRIGSYCHSASDCSEQLRKCKCLNRSNEIAHSPVASGSSQSPCFGESWNQTACQASGYKRKLREFHNCSAVKA